MPQRKWASGGTEHHTDRITSTPISNSFLVTRHVSYTPMLFPPPASLRLQCSKGQPSVVLAFGFKIGSTRNAEVAYRFDQKPGHSPRMRIVDDHKTILIQDSKEVTRFVDEMATSEDLYLRIRAFTAPRTSAEFKVAGSAPMVAAAYANCPLNTALAKALPDCAGAARPSKDQEDEEEED
jgi:hypothetical protein